VAGLSIHDVTEGASRELGIRLILDEPDSMLDAALRQFRLQEAALHHVAQNPVSRSQVAWMLLKPGFQSRDLGLRQHRARDRDLLGLATEEEG
jgi:hypothetical protein